IQKERRVENCGKIQICMDVEKGRIKAFATYGDYFGNGDPADIANALIGCPLEPSALESALLNLSIGYYFNNLTSEELIKIILQ
ncbi:MAG: Lipoate-protein ligase, partial [Lachnospiraceae bacterium]|nr:Lipoate-protein ligase [Lachnospiraceae bacterium]